MEKFDLNHIITIAGIIVTVIVSIVIFRFQNKKKKLAYEIKSNISILKFETDFRQKVEFYFEKQKIDNLVLVEIDIVNFGQIPIKKEDFEETLKLSFSKSFQILSAEIVSSKPLNLKPVTAIDNVSKVISIQPLLLNPNDYFSIKILLDSKIITPVISGRIYGVQEIEDIKFIRFNKRVYLITTPLMIIGFMLLIVHFFIYTLPLILSLLSAFLFGASIGSAIGYFFNRLRFIGLLKI